MTRIELLAKLEDEIAQGWPPPLDGSDRPWDLIDPALSEYIGIVADVAVAAETADYPHTLRAVS